MTLTEIRKQLSRAYNQTAFYERTNETHYPARWTMGDGVGDAMTGCHYDRRLQISAEHVADELGLHMDGAFDDVTRLRDAASMIGAAWRKQQDADSVEDRVADVQILREQATHKRALALEAEADKLDKEV